jgi:HEAT repeat protein
MGFLGNLEGLDVTVPRMRTDVGGLNRVLETGKHPGSREEAPEATGDLCDSRAVEPLISALKDPNHEVREEAAEALGKIGDQRAVEPLTETLTDSRHEVCKEAGKALERLR